MIILQIINNIAWGGAGNLLINYVPSMKTQGHQIELLFLRKANCPHLKYFEEKGLKVTWLSENQLYNPLYIFKIRNFIKKGNFDIVHVHLFPALYYAGLAAYLGLGKAKLVFTEHNTTNTRMKKSYYRSIERFIYKKYDAITSITEQVEQNITKHLDGITMRYYLVNNGINFIKFNNDNLLQKQNLYLSYSKEHVLVVMVARFCKQKDHKTLIKAIALLPDNVHLLLIGEGPLKQDMENLATDLHTDRRVHFLGVRNDVPDVLRLCDIGVLSSNWEGMPVSAIEIMAAGIPFVGSKVPGIQDFIEAKNDNAGILFTHQNSEELAFCIDKLLYDKDYCKQIGTSGKIRASEYSIEKTTNQYLSIYEKLKNQ
jgi:glycosyltransferase involved in cell wall biosynthesis